MENNNQPPTKINKTWFIQRGNDPKDIFACEEQEAWGLFNNRTNWMRNDFKIIGVSDGVTYVQTIKESQAETANIQPEIAILSRDLTRFLETRDNLKFKELLPDTDEKMIRVNGLIKELQTKLDEKNLTLSNSQKYIISKAFNAELDKARGHIEQPTNFDIFTPSGNREKILQALGK